MAVRQWERRTKLTAPAPVRVDCWHCYSTDVEVLSTAAILICRTCGSSQQLLSLDFVHYWSSTGEMHWRDGYDEECQVLDEGYPEHSKDCNC